MSEIKKYPFKLVQNKEEQNDIIAIVANVCAWILPFLKLTATNLKRKRKFKCFISDSYPDFDTTLSGDRTKVMVIEVSKGVLVALTDWVGEDMVSGFTGFRNEVLVFLGHTLDNLTEYQLNILIENPQVRVCADCNWNHEKPSRKCLSCKLDVDMTDKFAWSLVDYIRLFH
ncbi:TPA: hypothetical protein DF272_06795 [Candidatus Falkowbacteria bacterium]|nr:hypothetical protein [Candidatus Falkowbacteria bacterium]